MQIRKKERRLRRAVKTRAHIRNLGVARLSIHKTPRHIYAQVTDAGGAKVLAAKRGTSVSMLVAGELERLVADDERYEDAWRRAQRALAGARSRGGRRWQRDELHER